MNIANHVGENLIEVKAMVEWLNDKQYSSPLEVLSGSSIGQHIRHILEIYAEVIKSDRRICYDNRKRDRNIERNRLQAMSVVEELQLLLSGLEEDRTIEMNANYSTSTPLPLTFQSSLFRELAYALEHSVHHQAIVRIALKQMAENSPLTNDFGVSASTKRNRLNG